VKARHPFEIDAFVIMPDHLHMVWSLPEGDTGYSMRWNLIKAMFTRNHLRGQPMPNRSESRIAKREQAVWQRRFCEHLIRDEADFSNHLDYIHLNPVQHGLVARPAQWPHSSFAIWVKRGRYDPDWGVDTVPPCPAWMLDWN
jgi:putative transposase